MLAKRLKLLRRERELRQIDVANHLGVTRQTYSAWEAGINNPRQETLLQLAEFFGTSLTYLLTGELTARKIPLMDQTNTIISEIEVPEEMIGSGSYFAFIAPDDSMSDAGILKGYTVVVKHTQVSDGELAAVYTEQIMIRRVYVLEDKMILLPANPRYKTIEVKGAKILGKVHSCWFRLN